jgi:hypothetical protein
VRIEAFLATERIHQINLIGDFPDETKPGHLGVVVGKTMAKCGQVTQRGQVAPATDTARITPGAAGLRT